MNLEEVLNFRRSVRVFDKEKPITITRAIKLTAPYCGIICLTWILLIVGWYILGLPIGPGVYPTI